VSWLDRLLGTWNFEMGHADVAEPATGRHGYERVLEGAWVQLHWSYDHPDFPDATAFLSEDAYHYFDVRGVARLCELHAAEDMWTMTRLDAEFSQRSATRFEGPDRTVTTGERSHDFGASWEPDFTMVAVRDMARSEE
jgi:hypothetical protein